MKAIEVKDLTKAFRVRQKQKGIKGSLKSAFHPVTEEIQAVDHISFIVEEGEILAFIGPNGAGKSTTIKMLTGILYPDGGKAEIFGMDPVKKRKRLENFSNRFLFLRLPAIVFDYRYFNENGSHAFTWGNINPPFGIFR